MSDTTETSTRITDDAPRATSNRSTLPPTSAFTRTISTGWADRDETLPAERTAASFAAARRDRVSREFPGARIVVPAGPRKVRANDTDYPFRAHSDFTYLTGWGSDAEPDALLVLDPVDDGHTATLYFRERAGRDSDEFYANPEIGEFWIGPRPSLAQVAADLGLATRRLDAFDPSGEAVVIADADPAVTASLGTHDDDEDARLARVVSEHRLVKDAYEIAEVRAAVHATKSGFDDVIRDLAAARSTPRGERVIEGTFHRRARIDGNTVGYDTIAASGPHACILHWTRNDGAVRDGDVVLIDAGIEVDSLYTADITRSLPVSGTFTPVQRRVYEAVRAAADAAFQVVKPGIVFREVHEAAMRSIAHTTAEWGILPIPAEQSLDPEQGLHRRWMVHGTSHHLGLDVHDCAKARREMYLDGVVEEGMIFTIEPGLYFQPDDLTVPEELRGIGIRIEDDILVTSDGAENLSAHIPRSADEVEAWMRAAEDAR